MTTQAAAYTDLICGQPPRVDAALPQKPPVHWIKFRQKKTKAK